MNYAPRHPHQVVGILFSADMAFRDAAARALAEDETIKAMTEEAKNEQ